MAFFLPKIIVNIFTISIFTIFAAEIIRSAHRIGDFNEVNLKSETY